MICDELKLDNQLCFPLYAAARKVTNVYTPYLKTLGLTYTQYIVFIVLWEHGTMRVGDLCEKLYLDSGTLTPLLKKMEKNGYVSRCRSQEDERVTEVSLTQKGIDLQQQAKNIPNQVGQCIALDPEDGKELYRLLYKVLDILP